MAGADDDWTIRYKIDTKAIDAALKKVELLRKAMDGVSGVGGGAPGRGGGGRRSINQEHDAHINAMRRDEIRQRREALRHVAALREDAARERRREIDHGRALAEQANRERRRELDHGRALEEQSRRQHNRLMTSSRALAHNERLRANYQRQQRRAGLTEAQAYAEDARRNSARSRNDRRMGLTESAAYAEEGRRNEQARQQRLAGATSSTRNALLAEQRRVNYERELARGVSRDYRLETARMGAGDRLDAARDRYSRSGLGTNPRFNQFQQRLAGASSFQELSRINTEMRTFIRESNAAAAAQQRITRQMEQQNFAMRSMNNSLRNFARSYLSVFAVIGAAGSLYRNAKEMEAMQVKLLMGTGSKAGASEAFDYIKQRAQATGTDLGATSNLYSQLAITAKDSGMNKSQIRKVFEDTTTMSIGYGLGPEQQKLVTKAVVQMLSKQSVQAEEFKNQLIAS